MSEASVQYPLVAIRVIVRDARGRILLLKRANCTHGEGQWCLPGGKLDYGDSPETTVVKELREETGLAAIDAAFLFFQNNLPLQPGSMHCVNLYFTCTSAGNIVLNEESSAFVWVAPQEAIAYEPAFGAGEALRRWMDKQCLGSTSFVSGATQ